MEMSGLMNNITGYSFQEKAKIMSVNKDNSKLTQKDLDCFTLAMFIFMFDLIKFVLEDCVSDFRDYYFRPKTQTVSSSPPLPLPLLLLQPHKTPIHANVLGNNVCQYQSKYLKDKSHELRMCEPKCNAHALIDRFHVTSYHFRSAILVYHFRLHNFCHNYHSRQ